MVGARLYTDLLITRRANAFGALTLAGETRREHFSHAEVQPDLVIEHLGNWLRSTLELNAALPCGEAPFKRIW